VVVITQVEVPDVVGLAEAAAVAAIEGLGLVASASTTYTDCSQDAGNVTSQLPTGGTMVDPGETVDIVVRGVCDADFNCDGYVNSLDAGLMSGLIDTYGVWGSIAKDAAGWDPQYDLNDDDYINSLDAGLVSGYIDTEGVWGSVTCPGPGI
jgi:hypothetical protein